MKWDFRTCMVYGIYGSLGGGKSLTAVEMMIQALNEGHQVISNIQLFNLGEKSKKLYRFEPDLMELDFKKDIPCGAPRGSGFPDRVLIVIDEMAESFDQYSNKKAQEFMSWARHSSKLGQIPVFIIQQPEYLAKSIRLLIYRWIFSEDMRTFRMPVLKVKLPFVDCFCRRIVYDKRFNQISQSVWNFVDKKLYGKYYDTSQCIGAGLSNDNFQTKIFHESYDYVKLLVKLYIITQSLLIFSRFL